MKLIIGLGNPGEEYIKTRHNVGFLVAEKIQTANPDFSDWKMEKKFKAEIAKGEMEKEKIVLAKPQTFMNNSGQTVKLLVTRYSLPVTDLWIINDDIDLPLGATRLSFGASSAGHKGVQSIIDSLKTKDFWRLRIGIGPKLGPTEKFVLKKFPKTQTKTLQAVIDKAREALVVAMENPRKAMSIYNK